MYKSNLDDTSFSTYIYLSCGLLVSHDYYSTTAQMNLDFPTLGRFQAPVAYHSSFLVGLGHISVVWCVQHTNFEVVEAPPFPKPRR